MNNEKKKRNGLAFVMTPIALVVLSLLSGVVYAQSPSLVEAMELTLKQNDELLSKQSKLDADSEQVNQAWAQIKPQLSASYTKGKAWYDTRFAKDQSDNIQRLNLTLVQPLYSRKRFLGVDRAELAVAGNQAQFAMDRETKLIESSQSYLEVLKFQEAVRISELELEDHLTRIDQLEAMLDRGLTTKVDVLEAQSRYDVLRSNLVSNRNELAVAQKSLGRLLGKVVTEVKPLNADLWQRAQAILQKDNWTQIALNQSANIEVSKRLVELSKMDIDLSKAEHWPEVSLRVSMGDSETYETSVEQDKKVQIEVNVPIYQGGLVSSRVSAARFMLDSQQHALEDQKRFVQFKMEEILSRLEGSIANIEALQKSKESNAAYLESAQKGLTFGLRGVFDVLEAKARGYDVERRLIFETYDNIMAQIEFLYLIGKLSPLDVSDYLKDDFNMATLLNSDATAQ